MSRPGYLLWIVGLVVGTLFLDQATKWAVDHWMALHTSIPVLGDLVRLTYIRNPNAVFGIKIGTLGRHAFSVVSVLVIVVVVVNFGKLSDGHRFNELALALILGGAFGNSIDRIWAGEVIDFIDVGVGRTRWPVFNVADSAVVVGVILLALIMYLDSRKRNQPEPDSSPGGNPS
jgi:signal peptidase II